MNCAPLDVIGIARKINQWNFGVISKILQILGTRPRISKVFLNHKNNFSHSRAEQFL